MHGITEGVHMPLELSDAAKVAVELYLKEINEKAEDLRHQRIVRYTSILGLFTAAIGALLVWTLTTGARDAAVAAAAAETRRLLSV
jgi:hypothetical protein